MSMSSVELKSTLKSPNSSKPRIFESKFFSTDNKRMIRAKDELSRSFADSGLGSDEDSLHNISRNSGLSDGTQCHCPGKKCHLKLSSVLSVHRPKSQSAYNTPKKPNESRNTSLLSRIQVAQNVPLSFGKQNKKWTPITRQFVPDTPDQKRTSSQTSDCGSQKRRRLVFAPIPPTPVIRSSRLSFNQSSKTEPTQLQRIAISELYRKDGSRPPKPQMSTINVLPLKKPLFVFDDCEFVSSPPKKKRIISTQEANDVMYDLISSLPPYSKNEAPSPIMTMKELTRFTMERFD